PNGQYVNGTKSGAAGGYGFVRVQFLAATKSDGPAAPQHCKLN
ncbi:unnamed protein product, partial [Adineta steineri]